MKQEQEGKMKDKKNKKKRKRIINKRNKRGNVKKHKLKRKVKKHVQGFLEFRSFTSQWLLAIHIQSFSSKNWPWPFEFH